MWNKIVSSPLAYLYLFIGVVVSIALGFVLGSKILLPILNVAVSYPVLFSLLKAGKRRQALFSMLFWALCMAVVAVAATVHYPEQAEASIYRGTQYRAEMFAWIQTGAGREGEPLRFIPQHLLHFVVFCLLSVFTASVLSLVMGSILMNYMSFYVGSLITASDDAVMAALMGWHPWSIFRVVSFVILGVILGEPMITIFSDNRNYDFSESRRLLWIALIGLALDILLKAVLAPWWGVALRPLIS